MKSGVQAGADNRLSFLDWIDQRYATGDWSEYVHGDKLNKSKIALECGFARAVFAQNPAIKNEIRLLEAKLLNLGILQNEASSGVSHISDSEKASIISIRRREQVVQTKVEERLKDLEEQNAVLKAEVRDLRQKLAHFRHLDVNLMNTGRLLRS